MVKTKEIEWTDWALDRLHTLLKENPTFHCDDFWVGVKDCDNKRALGSVVLKAKKNDWIIKTGVAKPSKNSRSAPKPLWISRLYKSEYD